MKVNLDPEKIEVEIQFQSNRFTIARARFCDGEKTIIGEGISRRSHLDAPNPTLGRTIASGRAVEAIREKLEGKIVRHHFMG